MPKLLADILAVPAIYSWFRRQIGSASWRQTFVRQFLRPASGMRVLDIGCGPGDILDFLGPVDYFGFDLSDSYIHRARILKGHLGRFERRAVEEVTPGQLNGFDLVMANGVLHHLNDAAASHLVAVAAAALNAGGRFVTIDGLYYDQQPWLERFVVSQDRGRFVRTANAYQNICRAHFTGVSSTVLKGHLRIPYAVIIMESTVRGLRSDDPQGCAVTTDRV